MQMPHDPVAADDDRMDIVREHGDAAAGLDHDLLAFAQLRRPDFEAAFDDVVQRVVLLPGDRRYAGPACVIVREDLFSWPKHVQVERIALVGVLANKMAHLKLVGLRIVEAVAGPEFGLPRQRLKMGENLLHPVARRALAADDVLRFLDHRFGFGVLAHLNSPGPHSEFLGIDAVIAFGTLLRHVTVDQIVAQPFAVAL